MISPKKKRLLIEFVENKCELCKKDFENKDLEIHRIKRGNSNGKYILRNVMVLCSECHKIIHSNEF